MMDWIRNIGIHLGMIKENKLSYVTEIYEPSDVSLVIKKGSSDQKHPIYSKNLKNGTAYLDDEVIKTLEDLEIFKSYPQTFLVSTLPIVGGIKFRLDESDDLYYYYKYKHYDHGIILCEVSLLEMFNHIPKKIYIKETQP